ncbi:MAG: hypothetical protein P8Z68_12585 [Kineosporiaceae bacterium]
MTVLLQWLGVQVIAVVSLLRETLGITPAQSLAVLAGLLLAVAGTVLGGRWWAGARILAAMAWLVVNAPFEGPILLEVNRHHGVTTADLLSFAGFALAGLRLVFGSAPGTGKPSGRIRGAPAGPSGCR